MGEVQPVQNNLRKNICYTQELELKSLEAQRGTQFINAF